MLHAFKIFCYHPLKRSLGQIVNKPGFDDLCARWRMRTTSENLLSDVYDGNVWTEFQQYEGKPFLSQPYTFGLMLNIDWFKPFKHLEYSVGAMYLSVMNLPREYRFKPENILLVGLIPGPKEPRITINQFLSSLVNELLEFLRRVQLNVYSKGQKSKMCLVMCCM